MERSYTTVDGPLTIRWVLVGHVSLEDVQRFFNEQLAFCRGKPDLYIIVDMRAMKHMDGDARHAAARGPLLDGKPMPVRATAIVGGSFHFRLLAKMVNKAAALMQRMQEIPIEFFNTIEEALQWITKQQEARG